MRDRWKIVLLGIGLTIIVNLVMLFIISQPKPFIVGSFVGIGVSLLNLYMLEYVVNGAMGKGNALVAVALELLRLVLYGISAFIMYKISIYAVIGYAVGVVMLTLTLGIFYRKGTSDER